ncbi:MAG: leucine-rich repeat protein [Oscillospiraceae bacterium]|nr:leucine-rich repeat protein [Oscillospiraceae bacterium]
MSQFIRKGNKLLSYINENHIRECVPVPEGIVTLEDRAFIYSSYYGNSTTLPLRKVILPSTLRSIGNACFSGCENLEEINLPENLKSIGASAFYNCKKLKKINIPKNLNFIDKMAFMNCESLTAFEVDKENPCFASDADGILYDKNFETIIAVPRKFYDAKTELVIPEVKAIEKYAFDDCSHLECITLPDDISQITHASFNKARCMVCWKDFKIPVLPLKEISNINRSHPAYMKYLFDLLKKQNFLLFDYWDDVFPIIQKLYYDVPELNASQSREITNSVMKLTDENDLSMIRNFLDMKIFITEENIDLLIRHANETQHYDIQLLLTEYKKNHIGYRDITDILKL